MMLCWCILHRGSDGPLAIDSRVFCVPLRQVRGSGSVQCGGGVDDGCATAGPQAHVRPAAEHAVWEGTALRQQPGVARVCVCVRAVPPTQRCLTPALPCVCVCSTRFSTVLL